MPKITDITPQVKDKNRVNLFLDGEFYCGLNLESVVKCGLKVGQQIDKSALDGAQFQSERTTALDKSTGYIVRGRKTARQMREYLQGKGYVENVIEYVLERLQYYNYINDEEYATAYINTYKNKYGAQKMKFELRHKGVEENIINEALSKLDETDNLTFEAGLKFMRSREKTRENRERLYRHLASKGFKYDDISYAINKIYTMEE